MKVLLVDDEPIQIRGLIKWVKWEECGFEKPDFATSGKEALQLFERVKYDVVISDVSMPEMTGLQLIRELRNRGSQCSFIILSGYGEFKYAQEAIKLGCRFYVLKPARTEEIEEDLKIIWNEQNARKLGFNNEESGTGKHPIIFQCMQIIDQEYGSELTTQELAARFSLSSAYFCTLFKKEMDISFNAYLTKVRMHKAYDMLKEGKYQISEVAEKVGYQTPSYFSEQFKKEFGCTPKNMKF